MSERTISATFGWRFQEQAERHAKWLESHAQTVSMVTVLGSQPLMEADAPQVWLVWPSDQFCPCCGRYPDGRSAYSESKAEENAQA